MANLHIFAVTGPLWLGELQGGPTSLVGRTSPQSQTRSTATLIYNGTKARLSADRKSDPQRKHREGNTAMTAILHRRAQSYPTGYMPAGYMYGLTRRDLLAASALGLLAGAPRLARAAAPEGQLTWAVYVSLAPTWFDPAETQGRISPFIVL